MHVQFGETLGINTVYDAMRFMYLSSMEQSVFEIKDT